MYGSSWASEVKKESVTGQTPDRILPASFGGPILSIRGNIVHTHQSTGPEISKFNWRNARIIECVWSNKREAVFVLEDGTVILYSLFGELVQSTTMGQEAKDVGVKEARIFISRGTATAGVAVLTTTKKIFCSVQCSRTES